MYSRFASDELKSNSPGRSSLSCFAHARPRVIPRSRQSAPTQPASMIRAECKPKVPTLDVESRVISQRRHAEARGSRALRQPDGLDHGAVSHFDLTLF